MLAETIGTILTLSVFGGLGWFLARASAIPVRLGTWMLLVLAMVGGGFVGVDTWLLSAFGMGIRLNEAIVSCAAGTVIALMIRTGRQRRLSAGAE